MCNVSSLRMEHAVHCQPGRGATNTPSGPSTRSPHRHLLSLLTNHGYYVLAELLSAPAIPRAGTAPASLNPFDVIPHDARWDPPAPTPALWSADLWRFSHRMPLPS